MSETGSKKETMEFRAERVVLNTSYMTLRMSYPSLLINTERISADTAVYLGKDTEPGDWQIYQ